MKILVVLGVLLAIGSTRVLTANNDREMEMVAATCVKF